MVPQDFLFANAGPNAYEDEDVQGAFRAMRNGAPEQMPYQSIMDNKTDQFGKRLWKPALHMHDPLDIFMDFSGMDLDLDLFLALASGDIFPAMKLLDLLDFLEIEMDLDLFFEPEEIFFEELPLIMELLMVTFLLDFLRDCNCLAFFLVPAEADIFREVDLRGIRFPFRIIDGMRGLDLKPETFIFLPLVDLAFLDFLFLLEVASFVMSNSTSLLTSRCILPVLDSTIFQFYLHPRQVKEK